MEKLATILAIASGFYFARFHETPLNLLVTSIAIDAALAPLTAVVAARKGRSWPLWLAVGFLFGAWALAWMLLIRTRREAGINGASPPAEAA
jgi:phage-related holin